MSTRKVPNFFIVGAPKCGTTALFEYLREHPQVFIPNIKEPHYFCTDFPDYRRIRSEADYLRLFQPAEARHTARGEASVFYLYSRDAIANARAFNPDARYIVMLRQPAEMLPSMHSQLLHGFRETEKDFRRAWDLQAARARGEQLPPHCLAPQHLQYGQLARFGEQVERLWRHVPREKTLIILFEDFKRDTPGVYRQTLAFLGLEDDGRASFARVNANKTHRVPWLSRAAMHPPFPLNLAKNALKSGLHLNGTTLARRFYQAVSRTEGRAPLAPEFRQALNDYFRDDIQRLADLLGRDLGHWLKPAAAAA